MDREREVVVGWGGERYRREEFTMLLNSLNRKGGISSSIGIITRIGFVKQEGL